MHKHFATIGKLRFATAYADKSSDQPNTIRCQSIQIESRTFPGCDELRRRNAPRPGDIVDRNEALIEHAGGMHPPLDVAPAIHPRQTHMLAYRQPLPTTIDAGQPARYRAIKWGEFRALRAAGDYMDRGEEIQISHHAA